MNDLLIKLLFTLLGLYLGVLTWLGKTAWQAIQNNTKNIEEIKLRCSECKQTVLDDTSSEIKDLLDQISAMMDSKLDAWWNRIELNLMNDGRLPPKRRQKAQEQ